MNALTPMATLTGTLSPLPIIQATVSTAITTTLRDEYDGSYEIIPDDVDHILATKNKVMADDLTVKAISYSEIQNASEGITVYIGRDV